MSFVSLHMRREKPALSAEYIHPGRTDLRGGVSRQVLAIAIVTVPVLFGGKVLDLVGQDPALFIGVVGVLFVAGAAGGALYHPVRRFWWRGALAGVVVVAGVFGAYRAYQRIRPEPWSMEFALVAFLGAIPGMVVYYLLMRNKRVSVPGVGGQAMERRG